MILSRPWYVKPLRTVRTAIFRLQLQSVLQLNQNETNFSSVFGTGELGTGNPLLPEPFVSRAKAPPIKRSEKGYKDENVSD